MSANPYVQRWREWDERYADLVIGKRNWQITAGGVLLATIILAAGMVWLSNRTRYIYAVRIRRVAPEKAKKFKEFYAVVSLTVLSRFRSNLNIS